MYEVIVQFDGSPDGMTVKTFEVGQPFEETGDLLEVAKTNKWVEETVDEEAKAEEAVKKGKQTK